MNSLMPDAPQGAQEPAQPVSGAGAMMPQANAPMAPQAAPASAASQPSPEEIAQARKHVATIIDGLIHLTSQPKGDLTKDDVFKAASDMIARGAFPTPETRQGLVVELAKLPDDEPALRKALGQYLLTMASAREQLHGVFGDGKAPTGGGGNAGV